MATFIRTLNLGEDQILPRTIASAVTLEDNTDLETAINNKQDIIIAGDNITIASDSKTISATNTLYTITIDI